MEEQTNKTNSRNTIRYTIIILVIFLVMTLPIIGLAYCFRDYKIVRTTDRIEDYGIITGNISNEEPYEHIFSFFPAQIEESFSDVSYHYASRKDDIWAYECYLEFVVEDSSEFESVLNKYVDPTLATVFKFDERYMECTLDNILYIRWDTLEGGSTGKGYPIEDACIGKILYDTQQQRMIFWAFGVFDGSGVGTNHLHYFFDRFQIDPFEYQLTAYYLYKDQLDGVTYEERFGSDKPEIIFYRE